MVKERYPEPVSAKGEHKKTYCVGGAFLRTLREYGDPHFGQNFPTAQDLVSAIWYWRAECGLKPINNLGDRCLKLVQANDEGNFKKAWRILSGLMR